ncbi:EAL and HDOD domain-containing protein [Andreprevotia sp. IGB-42]|uniref:EAL and HDOD domain-containing protein n=1 Tax=Andreprevotia sp. IGB-42 TaxID=2497473 RepID=UPI001358F8D2|nr:HDOD domain-containing protein [Andreprevotia sp. IGB-42]
MWRTDRSWVGLRLHSDPAVLPLVLDAIAAEYVLRDLPLLYPAALLPSGADTGKLISICTDATQAVPENAVLQIDCVDKLPPAGSPLFMPAVHNLSIFAALPAGAWCSGAWPTVASARGSKPQPTQPVLLELLGLIARDADSQDLEAVFAKAPQLTISMLRLVNSVAISGTVKAGSLRQAITLLGRRQLQRWLQLLMYAEQFGPGETVPPLLVVAALRARRLEAWAGQGWLGDCPPDSAFFTGMLSCLDCLFGVPLAELIKPLPLPDAVTRALINYEGELGQALYRICRFEHGITEDFDDWPGNAGWRNWLAGEVAAVAWTRQLFSTVAA